MLEKDLCTKGFTGEGEGFVRCGERIEQIYDVEEVRECARGEDCQDSLYLSMMG